jgi:hypothetical protein
LLELLELLELQKVIGMTVRAGMLFAALSLAKTSPHRRPVEMLLMRMQSNRGQIPIIQFRCLSLLRRRETTRVDCRHGGRADANIAALLQ